jgi:GNAT superfamily N-acetyltransferase
VQQLARAPQLAMIAAHDLPEKLKTTRVAAVRHARQERSITNGQYYLLLVAALLLTGTASARAAYLLFEIGYRGMTWSRALWSRQHEEFRVWTAVTCADPWQAETVLCQAARGSWIGRELIRAKVATAGEDHCGNDSKGEGCRWARLTGEGAARRCERRASPIVRIINHQTQSSGVCPISFGGEGREGRVITL